MAVRGGWICWAMVLIGVWVGAQPVLAADGTVAGRISLALENGDTVHGDWIRVMLVTAAVDVERVRREVAAQAAAVPGARHGVLANRLQLEFYKAVTARLDQDGYVQATTLTTEDGTFKLPAVPPGRYWVVVTFPSVIRGHKVAWQVPATVAADRATEVPLTNANLLFPTQGG